MKYVGLTMRIEDLSKNDERRDCIDQRWYNFLDTCNLRPILIPNLEYFVSEKHLNKLSGIILTGGNSLSHLGGNAPEREVVEKKLIKYAIEKKLPLMGVCRGMQVLQNYYDVPIKNIDGHVGTRHNLLFKNGDFCFHRVYTIISFNLVKRGHLLIFNNVGVGFY